MASSPEAPQKGPVQRQWLELLTRHSREAAYGFFAAAALLAIIPIWVGIQYRTEQMTVCVWGAILVLLALGAGLYEILREDRNRPGAIDNTRMLVLAIGGLAGFATAVLGVLLAYQWRSVFTGGLEEWRKDWWRIARCLLALFGGLALMFSSLQLARADERTSPGLRRLVYGYNALLGGLILFAILGVINVLGYVPIRPFSLLNKQYDWTQSRIYSLSSASVNLLQSLDKPVEIYVILPVEASLAYREIHTLMDNLRAVSDRVNVEYLSPDLNQKRVAELEKQYQTLDRMGLLVVYGDAHEFVRYDDLFSESEDNPSQSDRRPRFLFKGENAVISKLNYLMEGKSKATVYFTQGHGELELSSFDAGPDQGLGELKGRLEKGNYQVKELQFRAGSEKVPDDAAVVVVARPTLPFSEAELKALRDYMKPGSEAKKKGKLMALLDVVIGKNGAMVSTGLENFLGEFSVQVGNDRLLKAARGGRPTDLLVVPNRRNQVGKAMIEGGVQGFLFDDVRSVKQAGEGRGAAFAVDPLLFTLPAQGVWAEANLRADPIELLRTLTKPDRIEELRAKVSDTPIPVAVTVSESKMPMGMPPGPPGVGQQRPRLVVFGDSSWVTNRILMDERAGGSMNFDLFASSLSWLRERPDLGTIADPKERTVFVLKAEPEVVSQMRWLPAPLLIVLVIGLGAGIWVVRRR